MTDTWNSKPKPGPRPRLAIGNRGAPPPVPKTPPPVPPRGDVMVTLVKGKIESIKPLAKGHPVFLVTLKGGSAKLVIKTESVQFIGSFEEPRRSPHSAQNAQTVSSLMGAVSQGVQNIPVTASELEALKAVGGADPTFKNAMLSVEAKQAFWVKMPFATGLTSFGGLMKKTALNDQEIAEAADLVTRLKGNAKAWTGLGQILVVDLFIGNGDRINWEDMKVQNPGNLIFQADKDGDITRAVGLDAFDPNAGNAGQMYGTDIEEWKRVFGAVLKYHQAYGRNAARIIESLNTWLKTQAGLQGFGANESMGVAIGMDKGRAALQQRIAAQIKAGRTPSGVMARAVYLGWA